MHVFPHHLCTTWPGQKPNLGQSKYLGTNVAVPGETFSCNFCPKSGKAAAGSGRWVKCSRRRKFDTSDRLPGSPPGGRKTGAGNRTFRGLRKWPPEVGNLTRGGQKTPPGSPFLAPLAGVFWGWICSRGAPRRAGLPSRSENSGFSDRGRPKLAPGPSLPPPDGPTEGWNFPINPTCGTTPTTLPPFFGSQLAGPQKTHPGAPNFHSGNQISSLQLLTAAWKFMSVLANSRAES